MSEAVLRARNQNIPAMISHKEILVPRQPSEAEIRTDYIDLVLDIKSLHKIPGACKEQKVRVSVAENIAHKRDERGWLWMAAIVITAMIIVLGLVIGYLKPGPITGVILPIGLALWWILYRLADHFDQHP